MVTASLDLCRSSKSFVHDDDDDDDVPRPWPSDYLDRHLSLCGDESPAATLHSSSIPVFHSRRGLLPECPYSVPKLDSLLTRIDTVPQVMIVDLYSQSSSPPQDEAVQTAVCRGFLRQPSAAHLHWWIMTARRESYGCLRRTSSNCTVGLASRSPSEPR